MEQIDKKDYIRTYVLETLNEIKCNVKTNICLEKERERITDEKMALILTDLINANFKNLQRDPQGNLLYTLLPIVDEKESRKIRNTLAKQYAALYYDNVELLQRLIEENIPLNDSYWINLQYLDSSVTSKFDQDEYIEMLRTHGNIFKNFVNSVKNLSEEEKEKYSERFARLMKIKYPMLRELSKEKNHYYYDRFRDLFVKKNLDKFTDETYEKATPEQLDLINFASNQTFTYETLDRINYLMKYEGFSNQLYNYNLMRELYSEEELKDVTKNVSGLLSKYADDEEKLQKAIELVRMRPDLAYKVECLRPYVFMEIDNYTLIEAFDYYKRYSVIVDYDRLGHISKLLKPIAAMKKLTDYYKLKENTEKGPVLKKTLK